MKDWNSLSIDRYYESLNTEAKVGIGILDISRDISSSSVAKRTFDMTYFYINRMLKMKITNYVGTENKVEELLENAITAKQKYCMIACQGLLLYRGPSLLMKTLDFIKDKPDFFVMGHIMDKKKQHYITEGAYPGLHRQYLFVNLETWQKLGKPAFDEMGVFKDRKPVYKNYELSEDTVHSSYTPAWIKTADGEQEYEVTSDGSNWIDISLRNNIQIYNLDSDMRACKVFLYPYSDTDILEQVWYNKDIDKIDKLSNQSQKAWLRKMQYQEWIEKDRVYAFNTETLSSEGVRTNGKPIDHLFSAAAGFKPLAILKANGFHSNTTVHYFDWCEASLNYKKHLIETWDGRDLDKWLLEHDLRYNFSSTYRGNYKDFWQQELKDFGGDPEVFYELWNRYRKLEHKFYIIDIVNESKKLFDKINSTSGTRVLWTTNIWSSEMLNWNVEPENLEQLFFKFEEQIPSDLVLYGHDYVGLDLNKRVRENVKLTHPRYNEKIH